MAGIYLTQSCSCCPGNFVWTTNSISVLFLPFIWIGNYLLVFTYLKFKNTNFLTKILLASTIKYFFLLFAAQNYFILKIVPKIFITSMGLIQFITALTGGLLAYSIIKLLNKNYDRT